MATRLNNRHQDMVRAKIQTSQLIRILQEEAKGERTLADGQRESAKFLINKSLGNPAQVTELTGANGGPVQVTWPLPQTKLDEV